MYEYELAVNYRIVTHTKKETSEKTKIQSDRWRKTRVDLLTESSQIQSTIFTNNNKTFTGMLDANKTVGAVN